MGISKKEVIRRYKAINKSHGSTGRNIYTCKNNHHTLVMHEVTGVTPMFDVCDVCKEQSTSMGYQVAQHGKMFDRNGRLIFPQVRKILTRPDLDWCIKNRNRKPQWVEHILLGGLVYKSDI
jgi:hypothetical protein